MNLKKQFNLSIILIILGFLFGIIETIYFGCNWLPQSHAEKICDAISGLISYCGYLLLLNVIITIINKFIK